MFDALIGWPGLVILLLAAALAFAGDVLREWGSGPRVRRLLAVAVGVLVVAGGVITVLRLDTMTGGLFS